MKRFLYATFGCALVLPAAWISAPPTDAANAAKSAQTPAAKASAHAGHDHHGHDHEHHGDDHGHEHEKQTPAARGNQKKTPEQIKEAKLDALWKKSDKAFHDGNYPQAVFYHRQITTLDPSDIESYSVAGWLLWSLGKGDEAILHLQKGIKANPKNHEMWEALGNHYANFVKQPKAALFPYQQAMKLAPVTANTQMLRRQLAHAAEGAGNLPLAAMTWRSLVTDYPQIPVNKNNLARVEAKMSAQ